jgi:hypothetical protein
VAYQPFIQDGKRRGRILHCALGMPLNLHRPYKHVFHD